MVVGTIPGIAMHALIRDFIRTGKSGNLQCTINAIVKNIFIRNGRVVSANSNLIDDRLGEIIYRQGLITLNDFVDAAGKVTKNQRFGDILIKSKIFTSCDLWNALNNQFREVLYSLTFYPEINYKFTENNSYIKNESVIQFEIEEVFDAAIEDFYSIQKFNEIWFASSLLEVDESLEHLVSNDFLRDMVALVKEYKSFNVIVESASKLSPIYTTRALYELYIRGILLDSAHCAQLLISSETIKNVKEITEEANFMFMELLNAAKLENINEWAEIITNAKSSLLLKMGTGDFLCAEKGFNFENILRTCIANARIFEPGPLVIKTLRKNSLKVVQDALYGTILFVMFELFNCRFNSVELVRVKELIDGMYNPKF